MYAQTGIMASALQKYRYVSITVLLPVMFLEPFPKILLPENQSLKKHIAQVYLHPPAGGIKIFQIYVNEPT
jgi:hypothetical protein